jgi:hypothetical protein
MHNLWESVIAWKCLRCREVVTVGAATVIAVGYNQVLLMVTESIIKVFIGAFDVIVVTSY